MYINLFLRVTKLVGKLNQFWALGLANRVVAPLRYFSTSDQLVETNAVASSLVALPVALGQCVGFQPQSHACVAQTLICVPSGIFLGKLFYDVSQSGSALF